MRLAEAQRLNQLAAVADLPDPATSATAPGAVVPSVDVRLELLRVGITGQETPIGPGMQNRTIKFRTDALESEVVSLKASVAVLTTLLGDTRADVLPRLALAEAELQKNFAADAAEKAGQEALRLKEIALESKQANSDAALVVVQTKQAATDAALALVQTRLTQDEAAIALAQQAAQGADARAATAQATANTAKAKADADETAAGEAKAIAIAARDTSNANQIVLNALNARFRLKRVSIPAITIGSTGTLNVVWDTPFLDDNYNAVAQVEGLALLGLSADVTARTKEGCTIQIKNGLGINITLASATVSVTATHY